MRTSELARQHNRLLELFSKTGTATGGDLEAQAHWAKYLCVLSAGFLENAVREIYTCYCNGRSSPKVAQFARKTLARVQNPKTARFLEIAGAFSTEWRTQLEAFVANEGRGEAINSIMTNRHRIAHGKDTNISLVRVKEYLRKSIQVVSFLERQCEAD